MSYRAIDPILNKWAQSHSLNILKLYQETEVRSVYFVDEFGDLTFQIWIDEPTKDEFVGVHVWDFKKRRRDWSVSVESLPEILEAVVQWTRTHWDKPDETESPTPL